MSHKRDHFRLVSPVGKRPRLAGGATAWEVIALSENGARIVVDDGGVAPSQQAFEAVIEFRDGSAAGVKACVQRQEGQEVVLQLRERLLYSWIVSEMRRWMRLYLLAQTVVVRSSA